MYRYRLGIGWKIPILIPMPRSPTDIDIRKLIWTDTNTYRYRYPQKIPIFTDTDTLAHHYLLPSVWTHPSLPDARVEVATWPIAEAPLHLRKFAARFPPKRPNLDVLLLVGSNCGPAMRTKTFGSTYPFAHHTAMGWALVGPTCAANKTSTKCLTECFNEHF